MHAHWSGPCALAALSQRACAQVIEHDDEETHASFSPLSTGVSLRSFPGTPSAALCSNEFSEPPSTNALGSSQGTSFPTPPSDPAVAWWKQKSSPSYSCLQPNLHADTCKVGAV